MVNRLTLPLADWGGAASLAQVSDAQLLHRFARAGEQQAFAMLVKRHGPMVWGVARRLLRSHQDAEDAFQASFLVLARKAASLRQPQLLTSWLHGVAHRTALHLRSRHKYAVPLEAEHEPVDDTPDQLAWRDCGTCIDQAIEELPTSLRMVFLLCQAEGLTTLAASRRLNLPEGTVVSRLHRARKQLQRLLARHGITSAAGAVVACWSLALPESLSALTIRSLLGSAPSALVAGLAQGVLTTMMWIKATTAAVIVSTIGLVGAGTATIIAQGPGDKVALQTGAGSSAPQGASKDDRIRLLEKQLAEARDIEVRMQQQMEVILQRAKVMEDQMVKTKLDQEQRAKALADRESDLRKQIESLEQKGQAVQQFLEKSLVAQDRRNKDQIAAQDAELERRARKDAEQKALAQEEQLRQKQDAQNQILIRRKEQLEQQERRQAFLERAKEQLRVDIEVLQKQSDDMQANWLAEQRDSRLQQSKLQVAKQDLEREMLAAEAQGGPENKRMKDLKIQREKLLIESNNMASNSITPSFTSTKSRLELQLKLREKLLLEVDEKLLRMQLKLDEK